MRRQVAGGVVAIGLELTVWHRPLAQPSPDIVLEACRVTRRIRLRDLLPEFVIAVARAAAVAIGDTRQAVVGIVAVAHRAPVGVGLERLASQRIVIRPDARAVGLCGRDLLSRLIVDEARASASSGG